MLKASWLGRHRGITTLELILSLSIGLLVATTLVLIFAQTTRAMAVGAQRLADYKAANELTDDLIRSADSSVASWTNTNGVYFAGKDSSDQWHYWGYLWMPTNNTVQRYVEPTWGGTWVADGKPYQDVTSFQIDRIKASSLDDGTLHGYAPASYELATPFAGVLMGNTVTRVVFTTGDCATRCQWRPVRMRNGTMESGFKVVLSGGTAGAPATPDPMTISVPAIGKGGSGSQPPPLHKPPPGFCVDPGNPVCVGSANVDFCANPANSVYLSCGGSIADPTTGGGGGVGTGGATVPGVITFSAPFDGDWNRFSQQYPTAQGGMYSYVDNSGTTIMITFDCTNGGSNPPCPPFSLPPSSTGPPVAFNGVR